MRLFDTDLIKALAPVGVRAMFTVGAKRVIGHVVDYATDLRGDYVVLGPAHLPVRIYLDDVTGVLRPDVLGI